MAQERQAAPAKRAITDLLRTLLLFLLLGAAGALLGTKLIMLMNGGACVQGVRAGAVFLLISACLAAPAAFLFQWTKGRSGPSEAQAVGGGGQEK